MLTFPSSPIAPSEFMESFVPKVFAELRIPAALAALDESFAVRLRGDAGGAWRIRLQGGALRVEAGECTDAALTLLQSQEDWSGALWKGRGGPFGRYAAKLFTLRTAELLDEIGKRVSEPLDAKLLEPLREIEGLIALVVKGGEGGDWRLELKLGGGEIPDAPNTTISITAEDADALGSGELKALEAFMAGRIQVEGDVGLVMQLQGAVMQLGNDLG